MPCVYNASSPHTILELYRDKVDSILLPEQQITPRKTTYLAPLKIGKALKYGTILYLHNDYDTNSVHNIY